MMLHPGNWLQWILLALIWPFPVIGDTDSQITCGLPTLSWTSDLILEVTCDIQVNLQYDMCVWERLHSDGTLEKVGMKRLQPFNNNHNNNYNNICSMSVYLSGHSSASASPVTPPIKLEVHFESFRNTQTSRNRTVHLTLPDVQESSCLLQRPLREEATDTLTCKLLTSQQTNVHLAEEMCTSNVLDDGEFRSILSDLGRNHKNECFGDKSEMETYFDVDMQAVKSLAGVKISTSGIENIRFGKRYTKGNQWFRFTLSFRNTGREVVFRFLFQRPKQDPLLVQCGVNLKDCPTRASSLYRHSSRRPTYITTDGTWTTNRPVTTNRPFTTNRPDVTSRVAQIQKLTNADTDNNSNTKTEAVTIVAAILGAVLFVVLVTIVVVAIVLRRKNLKKKRESRPSMCHILTHEEHKTDMIENVLYAERRQLDNSCDTEMIPNDIYRSQENISADNTCLPDKTGQYYLAVEDNSNMPTVDNFYGTGTIGDDYGLPQAVDKPSETMIYSTIDDSTSAYKINT